MAFAAARRPTERRYRTRLTAPPTGHMRRHGSTARAVALRGHLWQGRFASFVMDEPQLPAAARYVERNPVKARLAPRAGDWPWSSAGPHVAGWRDGMVYVDRLTDRINGRACAWEQHLRQPDEENLARRVRRHESTGRPLGDKPFVRRLEQLLGRRPLRGRPARPLAGPAPTACSLRPCAVSAPSVVTLFPESANTGRFGRASAPGRAERASRQSRG